MRISQFVSKCSVVAAVVTFRLQTSIPGGTTVLTNTHNNGSEKQYKYCKYAIENTVVQSVIGKNGTNVVIL